MRSAMRASSALNTPGMAIGPAAQLLRSVRPAEMLIVFGTSATTDCTLLITIAGPASGLNGIPTYSLSGETRSYPLQIKRLPFGQLAVGAGGGFFPHPVLTGWRTCL